MSCKKCGSKNVEVSMFVYLYSSVYEIEENDVFDFQRFRAKCGKDFYKPKINLFCKKCYNSSESKVYRLDEDDFWDCCSECGNSNGFFKQITKNNNRIVVEGKCINCESKITANARLVS